MKQLDLLILGGGLAGCMAAKAAAQLGLHAAVVERRGVLAHELVQTNRSTIRSGPMGYELPVLAGTIQKAQLSERLADGQEPLLFSAPVGRVINGNRACGALIANSFGMQIIYARAVLDTRACYSADIPADKAYCTFIMGGVGAYLESEYEVPEQWGGKVWIETAIADHEFSVTFDCSGMTDDAQIRLQAAELAVWLREHVPDLEQSSLRRLPDEIVRRSDPVWGPMPGWRNVRLDVPFDFTADDLRQEEMRILELVKQMPLGRPVLNFDEIDIGSCYIPRRECELSDFDSGDLPYDMTAINFPADYVRRRAATDVLVVGGGTAGFMAYKALLDEGADCLLLEQHSQSGGTSLMGMVTGDWHGYIGGINAVNKAQIMDLQTRLAGEAVARTVPAAGYYQYRILAGKPVRLGTGVCGSITENGRLTGVLAADEQGLLAVEAKVTIDATGDASIVALAGLPTRFGAVQSRLSQTFSQWGVEHWPRSSFREKRYTGDPDMLDPTSYADLLRGLYVSHQNNSDIHIAPFPTTRESRRIVGEYELSMADIYLERAPEDTICVSQTPYDSHGMCESILGDMDVCRLVHTDELRARIPYRCYIPKGIEGLLVTGKSFSGSRDAVSVCRMNPDLRSAGYALGLAAAMTVRGDGCVRNINIAALRTRLQQLEILPDWTFEPAPAIDWTLPEDQRMNMARALLSESETALKETAGRSDFAALVVQAWFSQNTALDAMAELVRSGECTLEQRRTALALIAKAARRTDIPVLVEFLNHADPGGAPTFHRSTYYRYRTDSHRYPNQFLLDTAMIACERLADERLVPGLEALLEKLSGHVCKDRLTVPPDIFPSYLELHTAAALARCGSAVGTARLQAFAGDCRNTLRRYAAREMAGAIMHPGVNPRRTMAEYDAIF